MNYVYFVKDTERFSKELSLSQDDINSGITIGYKEWLAILLNVFHIAKVFDEPIREQIKTMKAFLTLSEELPEFPLFSRIKGFGQDAVFREHEVNSLKQECNRIKHRVPKFGQ